MYQRVAASITEAIEGGTYPPGGRLPGERDLAEAFEVSRPTIREAMIVLEIRGLVEARHGSGLFVTIPAQAEDVPSEDVPAEDTPPEDAPADERPPEESAAGAPEGPARAAPAPEAIPASALPPPSDAVPLELDIGAFELTEARILFEGETAALAATVMTDDKLAWLEALLRELSAADADARAERRFYVEIAAATDNSAVLGVIEMLWDIRAKSPSCVAMFARAGQGRAAARIAEYRTILDALAARDASAARTAMRGHLRGVMGDVLAASETQALERARAEASARRSEIERRIAL